ncbi:MAG: toxic anion resistance protein [Oscillibacter sp.]|nr:toxic anion resistance protein [Oscillibacter sp.]
MEASAQAAQTPEELSAQCHAAARANAAGLDRLTSEICVFDTQSILTFGTEAAAELAKSADGILKSIQTDQVGDTSALLAALGGLMEKFDPEDLAETEKKRRFPFRAAPKQPDDILNKYRALGEDIDRAYIELKRYEAEIRAYDGRLRAIYDANVRFYQNLVCCVEAGEQGLREIRGYLDAGEIPEADRDTVQRSCTLLERRVHDLRLSEAVALQSLPMVQTIRANNRLLIEKLNSAFLVTLPIFRQTLAQAAARKRQRLQAQAMEALDRRTREALEAQTAAQARLKAALPDGAAQVEALEEARETILKGIREARALQSERKAIF